MRYLKNVVTLTFDEDNCIGCGRCAEVCPHRVFVVNDRKASVRDRDVCMECGACARNCPAGAIGVDSGVGCALAVIKGWISGKEPNCDCSGGDDCC